MQYFAITFFTDVQFKYIRNFEPKKFEYSKQGAAFACYLNLRQDCLFMNNKQPSKYLCLKYII